MTKFTPLDGYPNCANSGEKKLFQNSQEKTEKATKIGEDESENIFKKNTRATKNEKAKLARLLERKEKDRKNIARTSYFYQRNAAQKRKIEEAYLPEPNQDYTYQFFCGTPERIRTNKKTRFRQNGGKSMQDFWQSRWQGRGSDFN